MGRRIHLLESRVGGAVLQSRVGITFFKSGVGRRVSVLESRVGNALLESRTRGLLKPLFQPVLESLFKPILQPVFQSRGRSGPLSALPRAARGQSAAVDW